MKVNAELKEVLHNQVACRDNLIQYEITTDDARKLISWYLISTDLKGMIDCMTMVVALGKLQKTNILLITGMWEKMLVTYGKIFSSSKDGFSTLYAKFVDEGDAVLHQKLIRIRNSYLAHRGENDYEHNILLASVTGTETNCKVEFLVPGIIVLGNYENPTLVRQYLRRLKKKVDRQLAYKREKLERDLYEAMGLDPIIK